MLEEFIARAFALRDCAHYAHWATSSGYHHGVLGDIYSNVVGFVDRVVEAHIGNFDDVPALETKGYKFKDDKQVLKCLKEDVVWIAKNREEISSDLDAIEAILDEMLEFYLSSITKLSRFK